MAHFMEDNIEPAESSSSGQTSLCTLVLLHPTLPSPDLELATPELLPPTCYLNALPLTVYSAKTTLS